MTIEPSRSGALPAIDATQLHIVYISSAGHSGSTLLDMLIGTHGQAFSAAARVPSGTDVRIPAMPRQTAVKSDRTSTVHHNVNGNAARFKKSDVRKTDVRWRTELGSDDLAHFDRAPGKLNRSLGHVGRGSR